jgi:hypothetical protein
MPANPNYPAPGTKFKVSELRLGDVVKLFDGPFGTAIVESINKDEVVLFRPYGTNHDFASLGPSREYGDMSGRRIITLTGTEHCTYLLTDKAEFEVYHRQTIK